MRIVGIRSAASPTVSVGVLEGDSVRVLTDLDAFWADPAAHLVLADSSDNSAEPAGSAGAATPETARARQVLPLTDVTLVPPVLGSARVICIGLNYRAHVAEGSFSGDELPPHPTLFARWTRSLTVGGTPAPVPADEDGLDWEGEVAAYIGAPLTDADAEEARAAVVGYSTFNDLTSRRAQKLTSQWILGKNGDNSGPLGPLVTADEVGDLRDGLRVQTRVNGTAVQDGSTSDMIYELGETLALISRTFTLYPGDIICTGTPQGVGYARTPPWLLQPGDVVEVEVERLGTLTTPIVANSFRHTGIGVAVSPSSPTMT